MFLLTASKAERLSIMKTIGIWLDAVYAKYGCKV